MVPPHMASIGQAKPTVLYVGTGESRLGHGGDALVEGSSSVPGKTRHANDRDIQQNPTTGANQTQTRALLCVVCKQCPQYSKQGTTYPTCGLTCAQKLASGNGPQGMCCVCGVRPKYSNGSKQYRTCGTECAAKMRDSDTSKRMCDYCHQRPIFHDGKRIYPQCGRECRDNSRRDVASRRPIEPAKPKAPSKTNSACLLCWSAAMVPGSDLCKECTAVAAQTTGGLLQAPRGHATFNDVAAQFKTAWNNDGIPQCPDVVEVYKVLEPAGATANFMSYRDKISTNGHSNVPKGSECRRWHGTARQCDGFDPADPNLCTSELCLLCLTIRNSFNLQRFVSGICTSITSSQSSVHAYGSSGRKTLVLVDVVVGKEIESTPDERPLHNGPNYDAISLFGYNSSGERIEYDELLVFHKDAVRPLYIVVYD